MKTTTTYKLVINHINVDFTVTQECDNGGIGRVVNAAKPDITTLIEPLFNKAMSVLNTIAPDDKDFQPIINGEKGDDLDS